MAGPPTAFVAYSSRDAVLARLIGDAVYEANGQTNRVRYETWVYNDVPGNPLISPILDRIGESTFIIADVTTLNLNVVYEIAFAIGSRKRAYLIRHERTAADKDVARAVGISMRLASNWACPQASLRNLEALSPSRMPSC